MFINRLKEKKGSVSFFTLICCFGLVIIMFTILPYSTTVINQRKIKNTVSKTFETIMSNNYQSFAYNEFKLSSQDEYSETQYLNSLKSLVGAVSQSLYTDNVEYYKNEDGSEMGTFGRAATKEICDSLNAVTDAAGDDWSVENNKIIRKNSNNEIIYEVSDLQVVPDYLTHINDCDSLEELQNDTVLNKYIQYGNNNELLSITIPIEYDLVYNNRLPYGQTNVFNKTITEYMTYAFGS